MSAQQAFMAALFDPQADVPDGLHHPQGGAAQARFAVYRNNVIYGLMQNLRDGFTLLHALLGDARFDDMARAYALAHPPLSPCMFAYGDELPAFLQAEAFADVAYAADVARLDLALRHVALADDAAIAPLDSSAKGGLADKHLPVHPRLQIIASDWPLYDLFLFLTDETETPPDMQQAQAVMISRAASKITSQAAAIRPLSPAACHFITTLRDGQCFADAAQGHTQSTINEAMTRLVQAGFIAA